MTIIRIIDVYGDRHWIDADDLERCHAQIPLRNRHGVKLINVPSPRTGLLPVDRGRAWTIARENIAS